MRSTSVAAMTALLLGAAGLMLLHRALGSQRYHASTTMLPAPRRALALSREPVSASQDEKDNIAMLVGAVMSQGQRLDELTKQLGQTDELAAARLHEAAERLDAAADALPAAAGKAAGTEAKKAAQAILAALSNKAVVEAIQASTSNPAGDGKIAAAKPEPPADPVARTEFNEFLAVVQAHLAGAVSHEVLMDYLGVAAANASRVATWKRGGHTGHESAALGDSERTRQFLISRGFLHPEEDGSSDMGQLALGVWAPRRCMEQNVTQDGSVLVLRSCSLGGSFQHWRLRGDGRITGGVNELGVDCLAMPDDREGANIQTQNCVENDAAQLFDWRVRGPHHQVGLLVHRSSGMCVGVDDARPEAALPVLQVQPCAHRCNQLWTFDSNRTRYTTLPIGNVDDLTPRVGLDHLKLPPDDPEDAKPSNDPPRIACWIMTSPGNHETKAFAVNATWGRHCDILLFMTTQHHAGLNTVVLTLGEKEDRHFLWRKSILSWTFLAKHLLRKADWFMRADDDTYVNMPSLKQFLQAHSPEEPHFYGRRLNISGGDFFSGGSTNILSRGALTMLGDAIEKRGREVLSPHDTFADDLELGITMAKIGVSPEDTRDAEGRERFFVLSMMDERKSRRKKEPKFWYWKYSYYPPKEGSMSSSPFWAASHYITPDEMLTMEALNELKCEGAGQQPWDPTSVIGRVPS